jgi:uncharacterized protein (DUF433 family)
MDDTTLLGRGIYDVAEVARLVRRSADEVAGWAAATRDADALLLPRQRRLLSFYDLVTAVVTAEFRGRGVPLRNIRDARRTLAADFDVDWPLAHAAGLRRLASSGKDVLVSHDDAWYAASKGGQRAIDEVVRPLLRRLAFDSEEMASLWRPAPGVVVDPRVQAGAPCLKGTRLTTEFLAGLAESDEDPADIARDYGVPPATVRAAIEFERRLAA